MAANVAQKWASLDSEKTLAWLKQLPPAGRSEAASQVADVLAQSQPMRAAEALALCDPEGVRYGSSTTFVNIAHKWAETDPAAAFNWLRNAPLKTGKDYAFSQLFYVWAGTDPETACNRAVEVGTPGRLQNVLQSPILRWARQNGPAAANWALKLENPFDRRAALSSAMMGWRERDTGAMTGWVRQLPPGDTRDLAWQQIIAGVGFNHPEEAVKLAAEIGNEVTRFREWEIIARRWLDVAPQSAREWIQGSPLPAATKERLLNPRKR